MRMPAGAVPPRAPSTLSLRVVIGLTVVVGIALASALVYAEAALRLRDDYTAEIRVELERLAALTALALREPIWRYEPEQADSIIEAAFVNPAVQSITAVDNKGVPFASRSRSHPEQSHLLVLERDIVRGGAVLGRLNIQMSTAGYQVRQDAVAKQYLRAGLLTMLGSLLFILAVMHWRFARPVARLLAASRHLSAGRLDVPIVAVRDDELGALAHSLDETRKSLLDLFGKVEQRNVELGDANEHLEQRVANRTRSLEEALATLSRAQEEIIQVEKLASLGRVVAGVAHELNTPLGNALTVACTIADLHKELRAEDLAGKLRRSTLLNLLDRADSGFDILLRNLDRAAAIVHDFKQVAVDQTSNQRRSFDLASVSNEVLTLLSPALRRANCSVALTAAPGLYCDSFPGPYGQVLSNLIMNAVLHGYAERPEGGVVAVVIARAEAQQLTLTVRDDGCGMSEDVCKKIFDPFFTTKMGRGGTGLGMNIVQGIIVRILGGSIAVSSEPERGTTVLVTLPVSAPSIKA
ncbi:sensor histidine kinase [Janthinobacterium fluminis]|uniref:histidine kinase n=1 Tax=Janthinobacterium fluminis TaxID=2987524 RepID=A0ABT5K6L8_9BURK|nr:HAMP domain-containing sensor histidine kinase [Janthinobacterium fluminis]MDC8760544.1 HAMP domain-containing sensor histidine kinase [Janthinobacterium fluminis]